MKTKSKILTFLILFVSSFCLFANEYKISSVNYDITGCGWKIFGKTKPYAIQLNVPVDTETIFSEEEFEDYITDFETRLWNLRAFQSLEISKEFSQNEEGFQNVDILVKAQDSFHLLAVPYPKYDSNDGFNLKFKIKDTNFLGTLNTLSTDIFMLFASNESDNKSNKIGFTFDFAFPFQAGIFDINWINVDSLAYTFGKGMPEWDAKTGLKIELPYKKIRFTLEAYQSIINNFEFTDFDDNLYFKEELKFSLPVQLTRLFGKYDLKYSPYFQFIANWDHNGINTLNTDLLSPICSVGHELFSNRVDWKENMRIGYDITLSNSFNFIPSRSISYANLGLNAQGFYYFNLNNWNINEWHFFNRLGITSNLLIYTDLMMTDSSFANNDGTSIGERLRGIRDDQLYNNNDLGKAAKTTSAIVLNLEFPLQILRTNFSWDIINFDLQLSPFIDIALIKNRSTGKLFDPKDGFYCTGLEILVYPKKWSSMTVRGSIGVDAGRLLLSQYLNTDWRSDVSKFEISFGVGLLY